MSENRSQFPGILLLATILFTSACQLSPVLLDANDPYEDEDVGRLYFHQIRNNPLDPSENTKVLLDGKEITDLNRLDTAGVPQKSGEHEIEFMSLPSNSGLEEMDYKIKKGQELHLYYCQSDGSFHWYSNPVGVQKKKTEGMCQPGVKK